MNTTKDIEIPALDEAFFQRALRGDQLTRLRKGKTEPGDLAAFRRMLGLSQEELARRIDISVDTLQNWEQGRTTPDGPARALLRLLARHPKLLLHDLSTAG